MEFVGSNPRSLVVMSLVLHSILKYRNWAIGKANPKIDAGSACITHLLQKKSHNFLIFLNFVMSS